jgi:hypothetical protein
MRGTSNAKPTHAIFPVPQPEIDANPLVKTKPSVIDRIL